MRKILPMILFISLWWAACSANEADVTTTPALNQSRVTAVSPTSIPLPIVTATPKPAQTVEIDLFTFYPKVITVTVGTTITWINYDSIQHSVTSGMDGEADGRFDTGFFYQSETASLTFNESGTFPYFCMRHNHMQGAVVVLPAEN